MRCGITLSSETFYIQGQSLSPAAYNDMNYNSLDFASHPLANGSFRQPFGLQPANHNASPKSPSKDNKKLATSLTKLKTLFRQVAEYEPSSTTWQPRQGPKNVHASPAQPPFSSPNMQSHQEHASPHPSLADMQDIQAQQRMLEEQQSRFMHEAEALRNEQHGLDQEAGLAATEAGRMAAEAIRLRQFALERDYKELLMKKHALDEQRMELLGRQAAANERLASQDQHHADRVARAKEEMEKTLREEKEQLLKNEKQNLKERVLHELQEDKKRHEASVLAKLEAERQIREEMRRFARPEWLDLLVRSSHRSLVY